LLWVLSSYKYLHFKIKDFNKSQKTDKGTATWFLYKGKQAMLTNDVGIVKRVFCFI